ncbi:MAG: histidine biosynthesis bifunctional protein HisIE [Thermodesulfobacteriota bacterium]|nr:MAG: histidine biosynthesis bifunctional protein HisIE [Thermodesulfobacteriota bacterium]
MDLEQIKFNESGLVPVIVQDKRSGQVLMLAYANKDAIQKTIDSGKSHFWSRSREKLWMKGEESGNVQDIKEVYYDCDMDTMLYLVEQTGVACHTGERTCFYRSLDGNKEAPTFESSNSSKTLDEVYEVILDRKLNPKDGSYVSGLFEKGLDKILKKIGEEAGETIIGAKNEDKKEVIYETADLWFHSMIVLSYFGITPNDIYEELGRRFGKPKEAYRQES